MPRRQPSKKNISEKATSEDAKCLFCARGPDHDNQAVGPIYSKDGIFGHKNCLYFGAGLAQSEDVDTDNEGADQLFFFQIEAIKKEERRSQKLKCSFCKLPNASAGCLNKKCKKKFHFPCGMENGVMFNFRDFTCTCPEHQEHQEPHSAAVDLICHICQDDVEGTPSFSQVYCPTCKRWLHRRCVQIWAYKAGVHHLRCPMCNNDEQFKEELFRLGFELPDRDAEWEREGMYREQEEGAFLKCSAEPCVCTHGRDYSAKKGIQELIACTICGEFAIHRQCIDNYSLSLTDGLVADYWECEVCEHVTLKVEAQRQIEALYKERVASKTTAFFTKEVGKSYTFPSSSQAKSDNETSPITISESEELELESLAHIELLRNNALSEAPASKKARTSYKAPSSLSKKPVENVLSSLSLKSPPPVSKPSFESSVKNSSSSAKKPTSKQDTFVSPRNSASKAPKKSVSTSKKSSIASTSLNNNKEQGEANILKSPPLGALYVARVIPGSGSGSSAEKPVFPLFQPRKSLSASKPVLNCENPQPDKMKLLNGSRAPGGDSSNRLSPPLLLPVPVAVQSVLLD